MKENAFRYQPFSRARSTQATALFGFVLLAGSLLAAAPSERPNVALIFVDDLGWMDVGCYGSSFYDTPNIDRLASEGARFTGARLPGRRTRNTIRDREGGPRRHGIFEKSLGLPENLWVKDGYSGFHSPTLRASPMSA